MVSTGDKVLLGKLSLKMLADEFDISSFELVTSEDSSPRSGIKINKDLKDSYEESNRFIFTDATASKNADLMSIEVSSGEQDPDNPSESTYKKYELDPTFSKEETNYTVTLYDYIDTVDLTVTPDDEKAKMKVKTPERTDDDKLNGYNGEDEGTITYKEEDLTSGTKYPVTLNKLGEPDTKITITVTAEDGKTTKEYTVTIKRPYGIIEGSIETPLTQSTTGKYTAEVKVYKSTDVSEVFDWNEVESNGKEQLHEQLLELSSINYTTDDNGNYKIYVIPDKYDILIDKAGYLDLIFKEVEVKENETKQLDHKELFAGDVNKDGVVQIKDLTALLNVFGISSTDHEYEIKYDFNEDLGIQIKDLTALLANFEKELEIN